MILKPTSAAASNVPAVLARVIAADGDRRVTGLTLIRDRLFVLRWPNQQHIDVYDSATLAVQQAAIEVTGLSNCRRNCLSSDAHNNRLYVSDGYQNSVYKLQLSAAADYTMTTKWKVDGRPRSLSVNRLNNVLVLCYCRYANKIQEYTSNGRLVRDIELDKTQVNFAISAVQLNSGHFVCSFHGPEHGVSVVDTNGRVLRHCTSTKFFWPRQLAVIDKKDTVLVADCDNDRIVMLDSSLSCSRDVPVPPGGGFQGPWCLFLDEPRGRLYVGEWGGKRVIVVDNFNVSNAGSTP